MTRETRTISIDALARVEGEGGVVIRMKGDTAESVELRIFEPPRLFEAFLRGRDRSEVPDLTARICGICPVAYQMSSCHAVEDAAGIRVDGALRALRRLLYCGEWIESHALHVFMLHAPDFLGYPDGIAMAKDHPAAVKRGLRIKKAGNAIVDTLGGRAIHPVNVRVGGFYRVPERSELEALLPELVWALGALHDSVDWIARFPIPRFERDYEFVALQHADEYPFNEGRIVSSAGLRADPREFDAHFEELQVPYSTALHARIKARGAYLTGPLARFNLNFDRLRPAALDAARRAGLAPPCKNPFLNILVRTIEMIEAADEAIAIIGAYVKPDVPFVALPEVAGVGHGCTEAPRGMLYHRYAVDDAGRITDARIVPPTSQNQAAIEKDLFAVAAELANLPHEAAKERAASVVRNHDPCISCSTHFLDLRIERG